MAHGEDRAVPIRNQDLVHAHSQQLLDGFLLFPGPKAYAVSKCRLEEHDQLPLPATAGGWS